MQRTPDKDAARLRDLLHENGWTEATRLCRGTLPKFLSRDGACRISANDNPSESVVDIYGQGHTCLAREVGAGLAFVESADHEWRGPGRQCVSVRLGDVLRQGGRVYPVASVVTERTWYLTLPEGSVEVQDA